LIPAATRYRGAPASPTKVLLHFDGTSGTQTFTDSAPVPNTWTPTQGTTVISATTAVLGNAGLLAATSGDGIYTPFPSGLSMAGKFTIVFRWICPSGFDSSKVYRFVTAIGDTGTFPIIFYIVGGVISWYTGQYGFGISHIDFTDFSFAAGETYAIALSRDSSNVVRCAVNGVVSSVTGTTTNNYTQASGVDLYIGLYALATPDPINGVDELLISTDCLFTANYTVQTTEFNPASIPPFT